MWVWRSVVWTEIFLKGTSCWLWARFRFITGVTVALFSVMCHRTVWYICADISDESPACIKQMNEVLTAALTTGPSSITENILLSPKPVSVLVGREHTWLSKRLILCGMRDEVQKPRIRSHYIQCFPSFLFGLIGFCLRMFQCKVMRKLFGPKSNVFCVHFRTTHHKL